MVASTKGYWGAATVNAIVDERDSDMGGGAVYHDNRVEVSGPRLKDRDLETNRESVSLPGR